MDTTIRSVMKHLPALVCLALAGCAEPRPSSAAEDTSAMRSAFEAASDSFHRDLRANDTALFAFLADDVVMMPPGEAVLRGKDAVRTWIIAFLSQYQTSSLTFSNRELFVAGGSAVDVGTFEWTLAPVAGGAPVLDRGNYMQFWQRQPDGQWRFAREIWNSSAPAIPPAP